MIANLWPSRNEVMASGDSPYTILQEQTRYVSQIDDRLNAYLEQTGVMDSGVPLPIIPFNMRGIPDSLISSTACRLIMGTKYKTYDFEILRVLYRPEQNYPVNIYDAVNGKKYVAFGKSDFSNCLKTIFSSPECMMKIKFLLSSLTI